MRKPLMRFLALSIVMLLMVPGFALAAGEVGTPAPPFTLTEQGGETYTLDQFSGEVLVIFFMGYG